MVPLPRGNSSITGNRPIVQSELATKCEYASIISTSSITSPKTIQYVLPRSPRCSRWCRRHWPAGTSTVGPRPLNPAPARNLRARRVGPTQAHHSTGSHRPSPPKCANPVKNSPFNLTIAHASARARMQSRAPVARARQPRRARGPSSGRFSPPSASRSDVTIRF